MLKKSIPHRQASKKMTDVGDVSRVDRALKGSMAAELKTTKTQQLLVLLHHRELVVSRP
jgi:hypothetical protein